MERCREALFEELFWVRFSTDFHLARILCRIVREGGAEKGYMRYEERKKNEMGIEESFDDSFRKILESRICLEGRKE